MGPGGLTLTNLGRVVPVYVSRAMGPGAYLEFIGRGLDTLYTDTNVYHLAATTGLAARVARDPRPPTATASTPASYEATVTVNKQKTYFFGARGDDPWMEARVLAYAGSPASAQLAIDAEGLVPGASPARLDLELLGVTDWPADRDHHVVVALNGTTLADLWFDGLTARTVSVEMPDGLLVPGANRISVTLPGDTGQEFDMIYVDRYAVTYPRVLRAVDGQLDFEARAEAIRVDGLPSADVSVYRVQGARVTRLTGARIQARDGAYSALFPGTATTARYVVASAEATLLAQVSPQRRAAPISSGKADYLIIAHPDFLDALEPLARARREQGLSVQLVDVRDVYALFGHGVFDPQAIKAYIRHAQANMGTRYVLLGGGDVYDYRDYLGLGAVSHIPSLYAQTDPIVRYAPADPLYADVDGDGVQDLAIGRMPARTPAEMTSLVAKTLQYDAHARTAVFAADTDEVGSPFSLHSDRFASALPDDWRASRAYKARVGRAAARTALLDALNQGVALTSFVGHSSPTTWTFDRLFTAADATRLTNADRPTVVTQWGCWNTYYVSPAADTLAHRFLLSGNRGAAAVLGATTLTLSSSEARLGELLTPRLVAPGARIGDAIVDAKQALAGQGDPLPDVQLGWALLGDPTLQVSAAAP